MAATEPSFATVMAQWSDATAVPDKFETNVSTNVIPPLETARDGVTGSKMQAFTASMESFAAALRSSVDPARGRRDLDRLLPQLADSITASQSEDLDQVWEEGYDYFQTNSQTVNSPEFSYGAVSLAGGNVGNWTFVRVTADETGHDLEGWFTDTYTIKCTDDARTVGTVHKEVFEVRGTKLSGFGQIDRQGTALNQQGLVTTNGDATSAFVTNPSFTDWDGTASAGSPAAPTRLGGWTVTGSLSNLINDLDTTFRDRPGGADSKQASLGFSTNETISQDLVSVNATSIDSNVPYYIRIAARRPAGVTAATLTQTVGGSTTSVSRAVTQTTLTADTWVIIELVATPGQNNWPLAWNDNALTYTIAVSGHTGTGNVLIDDTIFEPLVQLTEFGDGIPVSGRTGRGSMGTWGIVDGKDVPAVERDSGTITDTKSGTRAVINFWTAISGLGYFRSTSGGTETIADS